MAKAPKQNENVNVNATGGDDGWVDVKTDLLMYKSENEHCAKTRLEGYLIDRVRMPDVKGRMPPEWWAYVVRLTAPCNVLDREDKAHEAKAGDEVTIPSATKIDQVFQTHALNPNYVLQARISYKGEQKIGGGKKLKTFDFQVNLKTKRARAGFCLPPVGDSGFGKALPQASAIDTSGEELPF